MGSVFPGGTLLCDAAPALIKVRGRQLAFQQLDFSMEARNLVRRQARAFPTPEGQPLHGSTSLEARQRAARYTLLWRLSFHEINFEIPELWICCIVRSLL